MSQQRRFRVFQVMPLSQYAPNQPPPDPVEKFKFLLQSIKARHNACVTPLWYHCLDSPSVLSADGGSQAVINQGVLCCKQLSSEYTAR